VSDSSDMCVLATYPASQGTSNHTHAFEGVQAAGARDKPARRGWGRPTCAKLERVLSAPIRPDRQGRVTVVPKESAGLLVFRRTPGGLEVLLAHPGGPFWAKKDEGAWSIPKGELAAGEDHLAAALREFEEETGVIIAGTPLPLQPVRQPSGKIIRAWALEGDLDPATVKSNTFSLEWPPRSGRQQEFPEIDRVAWLPVEEARRKIVPGQVPLLEQLALELGGS